MTLKHICATVMLVALPAFAGVEKVGEASVTFTGTGPAGFRMEGKTPMLSIQEQGEALTFTVPLATLETGIALRDKHMREKYLETQKYPNAELVVARGALRFPEEGAETSASANGTLTIHGQSRPVTFTYRAKKAGGAFDVTGATHINMQDYGIHVPSYLGVTVKPDVDISVHFVAKDS